MQYVDHMNGSLDIVYLFPNSSDIKLCFRFVIYTYQRELDYVEHLLDLQHAWYTVIKESSNE